ncbi:5-formyltetrahydrofolate cyclo-ligase [Yeosuana sp. MJ-SS3]|uniref:5-formyltetrahydrofolate cyclo-ligase n=1 Tax=Gilvirhabdus luticola TaxID=3079858 RepID=A0ABU3U3D0_9FLAO|nr:5-formyltetrahydrofolate cyclo-ligase [Yeosuana sp. MJ-SS3]MDU8884841.1 5-formyltetrahydrofolate cyclo-ligase [Yeosuana sp. MJ-SS3]
MIKSEIRKKYKTLRNKLSEIEVDDLSFQIANSVLKLPIWQYSYYHIFLTIEEKKEIITNYILSILSGKDKNIVVPKSDFSTGVMTNFLLTDNTTLKKNALDIPEPVDGIEVANHLIEVVFIPLLGFDKLGNRVGYGKGFYDKFLASCKPETIKIGLSFFEAEDSISEISTQDEKLDFCVTPKTIYTF